MVKYIIAVAMVAMLAACAGTPSQPTNCNVYYPACVQAQ